MNSATLLESADRCLRAPYLARTWQRVTISPMNALYLAIEEGLSYEGPDDAGQVAGDHLMTLACDRGLESPQSDLYGLANHLAALADIIVWMLRPSGPWWRPADVKVGEATWEPSCFLSDSGTRLRRVVLVDRWDEKREIEESHDYRAFGETAAYKMPMDQTVIVLGQNRDGRRHGPFTKAWIHPVSKDLRMRKRDGSGFEGNWTPTFREDYEGSREKWLDAMTADGILEDVVLPIEVPVHAEVEKIRRLMEKKLAAIRDQNELPMPQPSQCDGLSPCEFRNACWEFRPPSAKLGFVSVQSAPK